MRDSKRLFFSAAGSLVFLTLALGSIYAWYSAQNPCDAQTVLERSDLLAGQLRRYDHVYQFATSASRDLTGYPVTTLQTIQMDTQQIEVPACLQKAKDELTAYMGAISRAFLAFDAQEPEGEIRGWIAQSDAHYSNFHRELEAVKQCAPVCIRQNIENIFRGLSVN